MTLHPKHGSWLNIVESEIAVLSRQCLERRIPQTEWLQHEVATCEFDRNQRKVMANWQFKTTDARLILKRFYPS